MGPGAHHPPVPPSRLHSGPRHCQRGCSPPALSSLHPSSSGCSFPPALLFSSSLLAQLPPAVELAVSSDLRSEPSSLFCHPQGPSPAEEGIYLSHSPEGLSSNSRPPVSWAKVGHLLRDLLQAGSSGIEWSGPLLPFHSAREPLWPDPLLSKFSTFQCGLQCPPLLQPHIPRGGPPGRSGMNHQPLSPGLSWRLQTLGTFYPRRWWSPPRQSVQGLQGHTTSSPWWGLYPMHCPPLRSHGLPRPDPSEEKQCFLFRPPTFLACGWASGLSPARLQIEPKLQEPSTLPYSIVLSHFMFVNSNLYNISRTGHGFVEFSCWYRCSNNCEKMWTPI